MRSCDAHWEQLDAPRNGAPSGKLAKFGRKTPQTSLVYNPERKLRESGYRTLREICTDVAYDNASAAGSVDA